AYNEANELKTKILPAGPSCQTYPSDPDRCGSCAGACCQDAQVINYTYDALGNLVTVQKQVGTTLEGSLGFEYDELGKMTVARTLANQSQQPVTTLAYVYDSNGNRMNLLKLNPQSENPTSPLYSIVYSEYDGLNRLGKIERPDGRPITFAYDELSRRTQVL